MWDSSLRWKQKSVGCRILLLHKQGLRHNLFHGGDQGFNPRVHVQNYKSWPVKQLPGTVKTENNQFSHMRWILLHLGDDEKLFIIKGVKN